MKGHKKPGLMDLLGIAGGVVGGGMAAAAGNPVGAIMGLAAAAIGATKAIHGFGGWIVEDSRDLARLHGTFARAFAIEEFQQLLLDLHKANVTAPSFGFAAAQHRAASREMQPFSEGATTGWNLLAGLGELSLRAALLEARLTGVTGTVEFLTDVANKILEKFGYKNEPTLPWHAGFKAMIRGDYHVKKPDGTIATPPPWMQPKP
jgi:hypothetical protein